MDVRELLVLALPLQLEETPLALHISRLRGITLVLDCWPMSWVIIEAGLQLDLGKIVH